MRRILLLLIALVAIFGFASLPMNSATATSSASSQQLLDTFAHVCLHSATGFCHHSHGGGNQIDLQDCGVNPCGPFYDEVFTADGDLMLQINSSNECVRAQGSNSNVITDVGNCDSSDANEVWQICSSNCGNNYTLKNEGTGDYMYTNSNQSGFLVFHGTCQSGDGHWCHWGFFG